jgi:protein-S-isoprenylcysteine O-methyltransferase Ste14
MNPKDLILVAIQVILILAFISVPAGNAAGFWIQLTGFVITISGLLVAGVSLLKLGRNLTPFPTPRADGKLVTNGIYQYVRHPVYLAILLIMTGLTVYSLNFGRGLITLLSIIFFWYKSSYEERLLLERFPEYDSYRKRAGRFLPKSFKP